MDADLVLTSLVMVLVSWLPVGMRWSLFPLVMSVRASAGSAGFRRRAACVLPDGPGCSGFRLRRGGVAVRSDGDEGEERRVGGPVAETAVDAGCVYERARPGGEGVEAAALVCSAVVDFDGGRGCVDVDAADESELPDVRAGDCVNGQGCRVQRVGHRGQLCGKDAFWCIATSWWGRSTACRGGKFGCGLASGACGTVRDHALEWPLRGDPSPVVVAV